VTSIANEGELASENYSEEALALMGFKSCGPRIIRFDILDRLSGLVRQAQNESGSRRFQVMQEMLALLGSNYEDVRGVLTSLGYKSEITQPKPVVEEVAAKPEETPPLTQTVTQSAAVVGAKPAETTTPAGALAQAVTESIPVVGAKPDNAVATEPTKAKRKETKPLQVYIPREEDADGKTVELENNEFWFMPYRKNKNAKHNPRNNSRGQSH